MGDPVSVVAWGRRSYDGRRVPLAWACWAADPAVPADRVPAGGTLLVELGLRDLRPRYAGVYDVWSTFDLLAMIPDDVERWILDLGSLLRNPGQQLVTWLMDVDEVADLFDELPDGDCTQHEAWVAIGVDWRRSGLCEGHGGPPCGGFREHALAVYGLAPVEAGFEAHTTNLWDLTIEPHGLELAWGSLLLFVVEQIVLPTLFGPSVDGLDDMLYVLVGGRECIAAAGDDVAEHCCAQLLARDTFVDWPDAGRLALATICEDGLSLLVTRLRGQLTDQAVGLENEGLVIGTSDAFGGERGGAACRLHDENPSDLTVDLLGREAEVARCTWRAGLAVGGVEPDLVAAPFHGVRR